MRCPRSLIRKTWGLLDAKADRSRVTLDRDACRLPTRSISEFGCPSIHYNLKIGELIQMNALPDDIAMLQAQLESLEARSRAHDLLLAAIAAHLQALIAVPGFLASAFDSAAMTANSLMMSNRSDPGGRW
jgi:hypothetical protein